MTQAGAIAAGHPETANAAAEILLDGGNAFDAALAALCAACVAEPVLASLGGGGFLTARPAQGAPVVYDFFPQTPQTPMPLAEIDFVPVLADFGTAQQEFHIGLGAMAVPGVVRGMARIHRDLGSLPLARIVEPAAALARAGVEVNALQAYVFDVVRVIYSHTADCLRHYGSRKRPGRPALEGEVLRAPELADTLEALAREGEDLFYRGEIAYRLAADCLSGGGLLRPGDLADYRVEVRRPLEAEFNGARVFTNPPPSMGGLLVAFGLELMAAGGTEGFVFGSRDYLERLALVMEATQAARLEAKLHEGETAAAAETFLRPDFVRRFWQEVAARPRAIRGTTQISVIDRQGNAASLTVTNGEGSAYLIPGTGVMMNNMLGEDDINPHGFHSWPPDTRLASMMAPSLVRWGDGTVEATGSGGSARIRTAMLQVLLNELLFGMDPDAAVNAPRIHTDDGVLKAEAGFDDSVLRELAAHFSGLERWDGLNFYFGGAHGVRYDASRGTFSGAGDSRRGGVYRCV